MDDAGLKRRTRIPSKSVTRNDVARLAGVSVATVSYVLNDGPRQVAPETRAKVLEAIEELNYQPSAVARSLKTRKTLTVGLIVTDILNPFHSGVAKRLEEAARAAGYTLILCNSDENVEQELTYLRILQSKRVDGIILVPAGGNVEFLNEMIHNDWNLVQLDRRLPEVDADSVVMDNERGAFLMVNHMIEQGHRRIAFISPSSQLTPGLGRRQGYEQALTQAGIPIDPRLIFEGDFKAEKGLKLARDLINSKPRPTAIFAANNRLALVVMEVLREHNLVIPRDMALGVFDDLEYYSLYSPTISAVRYSITDLAQRGFQLLLDRMSGQHLGGYARHEVVPCTLAVRESTLNIPIQK